MPHYDPNLGLAKPLAPSQQQDASAQAAATVDRAGPDGRDPLVTSVSASDTASVPALADFDDLDPVFLEMVDAFTDRTLAGELVDVDRLIADFPGWDEAFRKLLPALHGLVALDHAGDDVVAGDPGELDGAQGKIFGDFQIVRELGRGGMGVVYEARQLSIGRRVALKVLPLATAVDRKALKRFQLEAQVAGLLQHPRIVPVHAVGTVGEVPYFAMQLVEGGSLARLIVELRGLVDRGGKRGEPSSPSDNSDALALGLLTGRFAPSPHGPDSTSVAAASESEKSIAEPTAPQTIRGRAYLRTVARLGIQAAEALDYAHEQGIVHRDVKPANLLLDRSGHLWIADFGMADVQGDAGLTMTGDLPGTLRYMSPEQAGGRRALVDRKTDIYSLGATLYELLTLQPAIVGLDRAEIVRRITEQEPEPIRRLNPAVPVDLATIVTKALSKEPSRRYETAQQLAADLGRFMDGHPIAARPVGPLARTWRWCRRKPLPAALAAALVLAVSGGFCGITWNWLAAQAAEKRALAQAARADAVNRFFIDKLLLQASPTTNPDARTVSLRTAIDRASDQVASSFQGEPQTEAAIRLALGQAYHELGELDLSETQLRRALELFRAHESSPELDQIQTMIELGHILSHMHREGESEVLLRQATELTHQRLGPLDDTTLLATRYLANLYREVGRPVEAEAILRELLRECREGGKPRGPALATLLNDLGLLLMGSAAKLSESERLFHEAIAIQTRVNGPRHPDTLTHKHNLASVLRKLGRLDEAERVARETLEARKVVIGPEHIYTLRNTTALADILDAKGDHNQAEKLLRTALEAQRRRLGENHRDTMMTSAKLDELRKRVIKQQTTNKP